ncbi:MAG: hypothetical protein ACXWB9_08985 [Flavisolibacter sp.]
MRCVFLLIMLVNVHFTLAQHTDAREMGLDGKIRKVTTYVYDSALLENEKYIPVETSFISRISYFFNAGGRLDSTHYLLRNVDEGRDVSLRIIYTFENGKRSGYKEYEQGKLKEEASVLWIDPYNYLTRIKYPDREGGAELINSLNPGFRDLRGEIRFFEEDGSVSYCSSYENKLDGKKLLQTITVDCSAQTESGRTFIYQETDPHQNPVIVIGMSSQAKKPERIWVRLMEYY